MKMIKGVSLKRDWLCQHCGVGLSTYVTLKNAPTHPCPKRANRTIEMQEKKGKEKQ